MVYVVKAIITCCKGGPSSVFNWTAELSGPPVADDASTVLSIMERDRRGGFGMRGGGSELSCDALMREVLAPSSIDTERLHSGELVAEGEAVCECKTSLNQPAILLCMINIKTNLAMDVGSSRKTFPRNDLLSQRLECLRAECVWLLRI